jgi:hypothetical protein
MVNRRTCASEWDFVLGGCAFQNRNPLDETRQPHWWVSSLLVHSVWRLFQKSHFPFCESQNLGVTRTSKSGRTPQCWQSFTHVVFQFRAGSAVIGGG